MKTLHLIGLVTFLLISSSSWACNCLINASATGYDVNQVTATIDNFSCTGEPIASATVNYWFNTGSCASSNIKIIVNGSQVATGVCANGTFDLTPYLPLSSVSVVAFDTDAYSDSVSLEMNVSLVGQGGASSTITDFMVPDNVCPGTPITPQNVSTCAHSYNWSINGPGLNLNFYTFEPTFALPFPGNYTVSLNTYDANGYYLGNAYKYINALGVFPYIGNSNDSICPGESVQFYSNSNFESQTNAYNVSYVFDFGDGSTDSVFAPYYNSSHIFANLGTYPVTMTVYSDCGTSVFDTLIHVLNNIPATAQLNLDYYFQNGVCPGTEVMFNAPIGQNANYLINYGDGTSGSSFSHVYNTFGTYTPTITVQNGCGNSATAASQPVSVMQMPYYVGTPQISVNGGTEAGNVHCPMTPLHFTSSHAQSYLWQFGDGSTSTLENPTHAYAAPGSYAVTLKLTDGCGNFTTINTQVMITTDLPVTDASIDQIPSQTCVGEPFYYRITNPGIYTQSGSIVWNFGDGTTSQEPQGYHTYNTAGLYTVQVTITNGCGNDTTLTAQVNAGPSVAPNVMFMSPQSSYCPGDDVLLVAMPYSSANTITWNLGNGDVIPVTDSIAVNEEGFTMVYHYGTYSYSAAGTYTTTATVTNICGVSSTQTITLNISSGSAIEEAGFFMEGDDYVCLNEAVIFKGFGGSDFYWDFGDGSGFQYSSTTLEPVYHTYSSPGSYNVRMIAKNNCGDTMLVSKSILIPDSQMNIVTNSIDANCLQSNGTAIAYVIGPNAPYSYTWSNGETSNVATDIPAGIYVVNVTDSKGCTSFAIATVSDEEAPTIAVSNVVSVSCFGEDNGAIDITPIGNTSGIMYEWSNGETSQDISGLVAGPYEVVATNGQGCVSVASVQVTQPDEVTIEFATTAAVCGYASGTATAVVTGTTGPYLYMWSNSQTSATATGLAGGVYSVTVIDNNSCLTVGSVAISETPAPSILVDSILQAGCGIGGSGIFISPFGGTAPYTYVWSNSQTTEDVQGLSPGQYYVKLYDSTGCFSTELFDITYQAPTADPVCVVTVTTSQNNKVAWEKTPSTDITYYNIYRESSEAGLYYNIGRVPYDSLSIFIDTVSNPAVQAYRYKVSAVDLCGTESDLSSHHKTIHLTQNVGISGEVNLIWDNYEGFSYATYTILRYDNAGGWQQLTSLPSNVNSYSDYQAPTATATSLHYLVEVILDQPCVSTKIENNNTTRSNRTEPIAGPIDVTGLEKLEITNQLVVYPNPASNDVYVRLAIGDQSNALMLLSDAQGRAVDRMELGQIYDGYETRLNVSDLETGIYTLTIQTESGQFQKRIVVQK